MGPGRERRVGPNGDATTRASGILLVLLLCFTLGGCGSPGVKTQPTATVKVKPALPPTITPSPTASLTLPPSLTHTLPPLTPSPAIPLASTTPTTVWPPENWHFPDSEVVYSPSALGFDVGEYLAQAGGTLSTYRQYLMITDWNTAADIVNRVAIENSINPKLLLALLEYQSGSVFGIVDNPEEFNTAMGAKQARRLDLYGQLVWAVHELSEGYYGWGANTLTEFSLADGTIVKPPPDSNPGTVATQFFFAQLYDTAGYSLALDPQRGFYALYQTMFGDPWRWSDTFEPMIPPEIEQPILILPFEPGVSWALTGGPHYAFEGSGPLASLDFAPPTAVTGCYQSEEWVVAMADGLVVRSELGVVVQDLDGDGHEQTGWVLMYLHIEDRDRVPLGTFLRAGDRVGHPSCEGGRATGSHVHIARKYNGAWIAAGGPVPFVMDGWTAHDGDAPYLGSLTRGDEVVTAHQFGSYISRIARDE